MKDRIKRIRKERDLTQQKFADRLGIKRNTVAMYEMGKTVPSDQTIKSICREFDVNEEWLRHGTGEMFKAAPSDVLDQLAYKYHLSNADYVMVEKFVKMKPEARQALFNYMQEISAAFGVNPHDPAYGSKPPQSIDKIMNPITEDTVPEMTIEQAEAEYKKSISNFARNTTSTASSSTKETDKKIVNQ